MMENLLISIIIPIYNAEKYLDRCLKSVCIQTYKKLEIILINDGSTDNSLDICLQFQKEDKRLKVISQTNRGLIESRKQGLKIASGDLIGFVDSDDWIEKDMYMQLYNAYRETGADLISSGILREYQYYNTVNVCDNYEEGFYSNLENDIYPTMLYNNVIHDYGLYCNLVNKLFKKELLEKAYENINSAVSYGEDCLTLYTYCLMAKSIYIIKKSFYHYNIREGSMCSTKNEKLLSNSYLLYNELKKQFYRYKEPYILMRQLKKYILGIEAHNLELLYNINIGSLGNWNFDYKKIIERKKIVIYGAGTCGQAFYEYLISSGIDTIVVAWVDINPCDKSEQCLYQIDYPEVLLQLEFDYIVIAVLKKDMAEKIQIELSKMYNIEMEKIIWKQATYVPIFK